MSALFWFNCLAAAGAGLTAFTLYNRRHLTDLSTWLVFFLFATSLTWLGEFAVLGLLDSYAYKPGVFPNPWAENLTGHLILNSTLWPATALLVVAYRLGYGWISLLAACYLVIEYLFLMAGLYEHHWWRYYMTAAAVILYLAIMRWWFPLMNEKRHGLIRFATLYFAALVIIHLPIPLLLLLGKQYYDVPLVDDMYRSSIIFILFYHMAEAAIVMFLFGRGGLFWRLAPYLLSLGGQVYLAGSNVLIIQDGWSLAHLLVVYTITLTLCLLMERFTLRPVAVKNN